MEHLPITMSGPKYRRDCLARRHGLTRKFTRTLFVKRRLSVIVVTFCRYFEKFEKYSPSKDWPDVDVTLRGAQGLVEGKLLPTLES